MMEPSRKATQDGSAELRSNTAPVAPLPLPRRELSLAIRALRLGGGQSVTACYGAQGSTLALILISPRIGGVL